MKSILVIGATGNVGRQVVAQLPATGAQVRALARNPHTAALPPHVEVARGDLTRPETLDECLEGVDAVFLLWTAPPAAVAPALERIVKNKPRIVFLSAPYKTLHPLFQGGQPNPIAPMQAEIERLIQNSGCQWTFLRPGMFAANCVYWWGAQIRSGCDVVPWPYAAATTAPIDERDIAAVAVRALCEDGYDGAEYVLTGPQALSQSDQISIIGDAIGRPLRLEDIAPEDVKSEVPVALPAYLLKAWAATLGHPPYMTSTVTEVTGAPPRTFRDWAADHANAFRA